MALLLSGACQSQDSSSAPSPQDSASDATATGHCDGTALTTLAGQLDQERAAWSPDSGKAMRASPRIATGLRAACSDVDLEPFLAPFERERTQYTSGFHRSSSRAAFATRVCADIVAVSKQLPYKDHTERPGAVYDGCGLTAESALPRETFVRAGLLAGAVGTLGLRYLLVDAGVPDPVSLSLARHLLPEAGPGPFAYPGISLPRGVNEGPFDLSTLTLSLRMEGIVGGAMELTPYDEMVLVFDLLSEEAHRHQEIGARKGEPGRKAPLLLAADRGLPWGHVESLKRWASKAGIGEIRLLVLTDDSFYPHGSVALPSKGEATQTLGEVLAQG